MTNEPEQIYGIFPFQGQSEIQFYGAQFKSEDKKILFVNKIIGCSYPYPFDELEYNSDKDTREADDKNAKDTPGKKPGQKEGETNNENTDTQNSPDNRFIKEEEIIESEDYSPKQPVIKRVEKLEQKTKGGSRNNDKSPANGNAPAQEYGDNTGNIPKEFIEDQENNASKFEDFERIINDLYKLLPSPKSLNFIELNEYRLLAHSNMFTQIFPSKYCIKHYNFQYTRVRKIEKDERGKYLRRFCLAMITLGDSKFYFFEVEPNYNSHLCFALVKKPCNTNAINFNEIGILLMELAGEKGIWQNVGLDILDIENFKHFIKNENSSVDSPQNKKNYDVEANYKRYLERIKNHLMK